MPTTAQIEKRKARRLRRLAGGKVARSKSQLAADRRNVADLYLKGHSIMQIAAMLGMSHSTVSSDLAFLREEWIRTAAKSFDAKVSEQLARLDRLEREAWLGWERSMKLAEKRVGKTTQSPLLGGQPGAVTTRTETTFEQIERVGDPRFLNTIREIVAERSKLLGLHAPEEHKHTATLEVRTTREQLPPAALLEMDSEERRRGVLRLMQDCTPPETFTRDITQTPDMDVPQDDDAGRIIDVHAEVIEIERETPSREEPK